MNQAVTLTIPPELVEQIAQRVTELLERQPPEEGGSRSPWLDFEGARAYLGFSADQLYKLTAARAIPVRKKAHGQGLLFNSHELDEWAKTAYPRLDPGG